MDKNELESAITYIKKPDEQRSVDQTIRYNQNGETDLGLKTKYADEETAAMQVATSTGLTYRVKVERGGYFYNPLKESNSYNLKMIDRTTKGLRFQFKTVGRKAFEYYVKFLERRYDSLLLSAEREL